MIWLTGNSGAGKTTIAKMLCDIIPNSILLDGDRLRDVWNDLGFSEHDRYQQGRRTAELGTMLEEQGYRVVVAVICPYRELRNELEQNHNIIWIKLRGGKEPSEEYPYEQ